MAAGNSQRQSLHRDTFTFNKEDGGGAALHITIDYFDNGDAAQKLTLESYGNSASFYLTSGFTPENLRELANIMERGYNLALSKVKKVV